MVLLAWARRCWLDSYSVPCKNSDMKYELITLLSIYNYQFVHISWYTCYPDTHVHVSIEITHEHKLSFVVDTHNSIHPKSVRVIIQIQFWFSFSNIMFWLLTGLSWSEWILVSQMQKLKLENFPFLWSEGVKEANVTSW
jgi:hypothetical protein